MARATILDVAAKAGVSATTVSHALSGKGRMSDAVRERVAQAALDLNYRPSSVAQSLVHQRTRMIGVLISELTNPYSGTILEHMSHDLRECGYKMVLGLTPDRDMAVDYVRDFSAGGADGVINLATSISYSQILQICPDLPVVQHMSYDPAVPVFVDVQGGAHRMMRHLWELGHRRIGLILHEAVVVTRHVPHRIAYEHFLMSQGLAMDEDLVVSTRDTPEAVVKAAARLYERGVTAISCVYDQMATAVLQWAGRNGIAVPKDLSVAGFGDTWIVQDMAPMLTTVRIPADTLSKAMVEALLAIIEGGKNADAPVCPEILLELVVRETTGPAPTAG
jgi:LacI family transcriptional regulator